MAAALARRRHTRMGLVATLLDRVGRVALVTPAGAAPAVSVRRRVLLARLRALFWVVLGVASFPLGWAQSIVLVWLASVYANGESAWSSAEAAKPDPETLTRLDALERALYAVQFDQRRILRALDRIYVHMPGGPEE